MPRPKKNTEPLAVHEVSTMQRRGFELTNEERAEFRKMIQSPVFVKAWTIAHYKKPRAEAGAGVYESALGQHIANLRLQRIVGWEKFADALTELVEPPKPAPIPVPFDYKQD